MTAKPFLPIKTLIETGALTPTGLKLDRPMTYNRCEAVARFLGSLRDATAWATGDLLSYVEITYGENEMHQLAESTGRSPDRLADYLRVSRGVASAQRRSDLSWTHHRHVAKLAPDDQDYWLSRAEEKRWTSHELLVNIRESRTPSASGETGGGAVDGPTATPDLEKAARALVRVGNPDGNGFILVPVDAWARFRSALGED